MADARTLIGLGSAVISVPLLASAAAAGAPAGLPGRLVERLSIAAPSGVSGPDDITRLAREGIDGGREVVYLAYQNGINPDGTAGTPGGPTSSTIKGFDAVTGRLVMSVPAPGKVDGLSADPARGRLLATVNEDSNSALLTVTPGVDKPVTRYTYRPDPAVGGNGGTDSIAVHAGHIYLAHSNPTDATQATDYEATLDPRAQTAALRPVFLDNTMATDASTGHAVTLGLTDPDTNLIMPRGSRRFAGQLATIGQADGQIVFADHPEHTTPGLTQLSLTDSTPGNVPTLDGIAVATVPTGTLYVVDAGTGGCCTPSTPGDSPPGRCSSVRPRITITRNSPPWT